MEAPDYAWATRDLQHTREKLYAATRRIAELAVYKRALEMLLEDLDKRGLWWGKDDFHEHMPADDVVAHFIERARKELGQ